MPDGYRDPGGSEYARGGRAAPKRVHSLFRDAHDGIAYASFDGALLEVNEAFGRLTGHEQPALLSMTLPALTPAEYHETSARMMRSAVETGNAVGYEQEFIRRSGDRVPVWVGLFVVRDDEGAPDGLGVIARDLRERRAAEQALRHVHRIESLRVLARGVAHDFNNVLGTVVGHLTLANQSLPAASPAGEHMRRAQQAVRRAATLVDQLLLYAGGGEYRPTPTDLNTFIEDLCPLFAAAIGDRGRLMVESSPEVEPLLVDRVQVQQLLMQLVLNAVEARAHDDVTVTIRSGVRYVSTQERPRWSRTGIFLREGRYAALEIEDDGCGMDADSLPRAFDPFYSTKFIGRGLGLATALGIVRAHHGGIDIESRATGGTRVTVLLPFGHLPLPLPAPRPAAVRAPGTVLLVEDEQDILSFASHVLREGGFTVLCARDGAAGVELFREHRAEVQLVVLDLSMPRMGGEAALREIRAIDPAVRVLLTSGYSTADATASFAPDDLAGFLHKPYDGETLLAKVQECGGIRPRERS